MLRDITIGQHFPGTSLVHRFDPRMKLVLTIVYIILLFAASNPLGLTLSLVFLVAMYGVAKIPFKLITKSLKPILPIILFTAVLNLFFVSGEGEPLVHFWVLNIYAEGLRYAILMAVRVMALIAGTSLLTYTTSPIVLTDAIEQLLKPLGRLHFPVHELAMMMSIALRFIPTLIEETDKIMNAQKARGAQLDNGKMTERIKALVPVLVPLFISAFRRADELAMAMECRCYRGGDGRTRLKVLRCEKQDYIDLAVCIACFAVILGFIPKMAEVIGSMPSAIVGGVSFILYGMISAVGVRNVVENRVDLTKSRNLIIAAVMFVSGLGFSSVGGITFTVGGAAVTLSGLAIAALCGVILNAILPGNDYEFGVSVTGDKSADLGSY